MKSERKLKILLELTEKEACDLYISIKPPYLMDAPNDVKKEIEKCLMYQPREAPEI